MTMRSSFSAGAAAGATVVIGVTMLAGAAPAAAAETAPDVDTRVSSWDAAAARLGTAGSLWEPQETVELSRTRRIAVLADNLAFANGAVTDGDTFAGTRYGTAKRNFWIDEKWADTGWAAEPATSTSTAKVRTVRIRLGSPGTTTTVTARVYADCVEQPTDADPTPIPAGFRCTRGDVLRSGGTLVMTARPPSQMKAPGTTSIVIRSTGLTFAELVSVARSLEQVAGSTGDGAGSAQMVAMCRQMVDQRMAFDQASAFAESNGYTARVGSIDGEPQAVTADYRPDRFTVSTVSGAVASCTYG
jgi:hypothetical protein